ncbi:hypothetical protein L2E82_51736 [Cichorium intybus]|nr:hypothetical protein L2E82_51736 [Cichorium intybus]
MACYYPNLESDYEASASSKPINLKLIFSDDVSSPVFTKQKITRKAGGNESIIVRLIDAKTGQKVTTGPEAFAKVKIVEIMMAPPPKMESSRKISWSAGEKRKIFFKVMLMFILKMGAEQSVK